MDDKLPLRSRALQFLRDLRGWNPQELADAAGVSPKMIYRWENGTRVPSPARLQKLAREMGHTETTLREVLRLLSPPIVPTERWVGPVHFSAEQERILDDFCDDGGRLVAFSLRQGIVRENFQMAVDREREEAQALRTALVAERALRKAVRQKPEYQTWAVAELLCEESIRAAAHDPQRALELAEAAVVVSELAPGEEEWRLRVQGYAYAHVGNAWRVIGKLQLSDQAFIRCGEKWKAGEGGDTGRLLNEGRVFGLEASLRREQDRPQEALALLGQGLAVSNAKERSYLLLSKAIALAAARDYEEALKQIRIAAPNIKKNTPILIPNLLFELTVNLCNLARFTEASQTFQELRGHAARLGDRVFSLRTKWLEAKIEAGLGHMERAIELFSPVREDFTALGMSYDAALVCMELAEILLQLQRVHHVKALTRQLAPIFTDERLHEKASKALLLFCKAGEAEAATVELVRSIAEYLQRSRGKPDLEFSPT